MYAMYDKMNLHLFDGAAAGTGAGDAGAAAADGAAQGGEQKAGDARRQSGDLSTVIYGKQPQTEQAENGSDAGSGKEGQPAAEPTPDAQDRRKAFLDLVRGEYKDIYTEEVQRIINSRFKENKATERRQADSEKLIGILSERYADAAGDPVKLAKAVADDSVLWEQQAGEADMTPEQYQAMKRLERENAALKAAEEKRRADEYAAEQAKRWRAEADRVREKFPAFDLQKELQNDRFVAALRAGVPLEAAYAGLHYDDLVKTAADAAVEAAKKGVVDNIQARGMRPKENGAAAASAFTVRSDPSQLKKADRDEIERRVRRGERIEF